MSLIPPTRVFITVDTEVWPRSPNWRETNLAEEMDCDIYGITKFGEYGLRYQLDVLERHNLKAVFFVESLFASAIGSDRLREIVDLIRSKEQDVQLHLHPEWLKWIDGALGIAKRSEFLKDFHVDDQTALIDTAATNLRNADVPSLCAFRAGNYGANLQTLTALRRSGIRYDTSYNFPYLSTYCGMHLAEPLLCPTEIDGVTEFPILFYQDSPGRFRHMQITACSFGELCHLLRQARASKFHSVVLVSHSFEFLKNRKRRSRPILPDPVCIRRFERLCEFLASHRDEFQTCSFTEINGITLPTELPKSAISSNVLRTAWRQAEQLYRRVF